MQRIIPVEHAPDSRAVERSDELLPVRVFILYQDLAAGRRAMELYQQLSLTLEGEFQFTQKMWKFDLLRVPKIREVANADMAASDLIFLAASGEGELPLDFRIWLETSLVANRRGPAALAALLHSSEPSPCPELASYLKRITSERRLKLFINHTSPAQTGKGRRFQADDSLSGEMPFSRSSPVREWGINE